MFSKFFNQMSNAKSECFHIYTSVNIVYITHTTDTNRRFSIRSCISLVVPNNKTLDLKDCWYVNVYTYAYVYAYVCVYVCVCVFNCHGTIRGCGQAQQFIMCNY